MLERLGLGLGGSCYLPSGAFIGMRDIFEQPALLRAYDRVLPVARHYQDVLRIHLHELADCNEIIDLGCGTGIPTIELLAAGKRVTAVDTSATSLRQLRNKSIPLGYSQRLTLAEADVTNLQQIPSYRFDGASSMIVAHLLGAYADHIRETYRVLKPGGRFVITARAAGQDPELLVKSVKNSLVTSGAYENLEDDFLLLASTLLSTANARSSSLMSPTDAAGILQEAGFRHIQQVSNKTLKVMYTFVAEKL